MSEPPPEGFPPLDPEAFRRMEEAFRQAGGLPDFVTTAIETIAGVHAQWYRAWQEAGVPECRAAEWTEVMIEATARSGS
jgi:hypothetical protein